MGIGATLREAREAQDRSLEDVAARLRARPSQLEALEDERFGDFGGDVYARGFLRSYAAELGLDPAPLLEIYRREVQHDIAGPVNLTTSVTVGTPGRQRSAPPAWMAWVLVAVVVLAGVSLLGSLDGGRTPDQAAPTEPPPAPAASEDDVDESDSEADEGDDGGEGEQDTGGTDAPDEVSEPEPGVEPEPEGVDLLLAFEEDSWMRIIVDGTLFLEQLVDAGETLQIPQGDREIEVRFGNAGGVRANLNGEDLGVQGSSGQAITLRYTQHGFEEA